MYSGEATMVNAGDHPLRIDMTQHAFALQYSGLSRFRHAAIGVIP